MRAETLEVVGLVAGYGATTIIEDVSLSLPAGGKIAILGRNGVGKTTLLATLVGLTTLQSGSIKLGGVEITGRPSAWRAMHGLGYVPQNRDVFPSLTVQENLIAGLKGRPTSDVAFGYKLFPRLSERRLNFASQLSGGEQQMLSIARAILGRPTVLLLDEPLEGLAPAICDEVMTALDDLARDRSMTIVLVEQQIQRAMHFAEETIILNRGRVAWKGTSDDLKQQPDLVVAHLGVGEYRPAL